MIAWDVRQHANVPEPMSSVQGLTERLLSKLDMYREACGRVFAPRLEPVGSRAKARSGILGDHPPLMKDESYSAFAFSTILRTSSKSSWAS